MESDRPVTLVMTPDELGAVVREAVRAELYERGTDDQILTREETAELLRVHPATISKLTKKGLVGAKIGSDWRFRRSDVFRFINSQREKGAA